MARAMAQRAPLLAPRRGKLGHSDQEICALQGKGARHLGKAQVVADL